MVVTQTVEIFLVMKNHRKSSHSYCEQKTIYWEQTDRWNTCYLSVNIWKSGSPDIAKKHILFNMYPLTKLITSQNDRLRITFPPFFVFPFCGQLCRARWRTLSLSILMSNLLSDRQMFVFLKSILCFGLVLGFVCNRRT